MPPDVYVASLARKRMAASALFRDEAGRVLLVEPGQAREWDLPGGAVEAEEPACGVPPGGPRGTRAGPRAGRVLAVDWVPSRPDRPDGLIVVYDGGIFTDELNSKRSGRGR